MEEKRQLKISRVLNWLYKQIKQFIPSILLIVFLGVIMTVFSVSSAIASKNMVDAAISKEKEKAVQFGVVFFVVIFGQIGLRAVISARTVKVTELLSNSIRVNLYRHIAHSNWSELINYHSADILTRMTSDVNIITDGIIRAVPNILTLGVQLVFAFFTLYNYDKILAFFAVLIGPLTVIFYRLFSRKLKALHVKIQESEGAYRSYIHECIQNITIVKAFSMEENSTNKISNLQNDRMNWVIKRNRVSIGAGSMLSIGYYLGYLLAFSWGAFRLSTGAITYGMLTAFFQLVNQVQTPFIAIARSIPQLIESEASATRIMELEKLTLEKTAAHNVKIEKAGIRLKDVQFQYNEDQPVIKNATVDIHPGELVAIIGPSGEGKTTIVRLILSLLEKKYGKISIADGNNEYEIDSSFRNIISYVPQGNTLFSGTILENLKVGNPEATEEEIYDALKSACAFDFVNELEKGINSVVGEKGVRLSEGQAQRLAIARALLRKAPILILDEATSALDEITELYVLNAIKNMRPRPTCLFITHRPTVYNQSGRVLKLENGVLTEKAS